MPEPSDLSRELAQLIEEEGPISIERFMGAANKHYYATRDAIGASGDFITAPEISQMFGEIIGLALADVWQRAGKPDDAVLVELGPGRGTLADDMLRAMKVAGSRRPSISSRPARSCARNRRSCFPTRRGTKRFRPCRTIGRC